MITKERPTLRSWLSIGPRIAKAPSYGVAPFALAGLGPFYDAAARAAKRLFDVIFAAFGLLAAAPIIAVVAIVIKLSSPGPVLFFQRRIGLDQRPFVLVKLRTMDGHRRVTPFSRVLRATGFDEIPQLWNVLMGEMSLIGPRPEIVGRVELYERELAGYGRRHLMRPGITGWAQVNSLRGNVSISERLRFDLKYVEHWSPMLDCRIVFRTVSAVWKDTRRVLRPGTL